MDVHTVMGYEGNGEEKDSAGGTTEEPKNLFFMKPDHEEVRTNEDPDSQE